METNTPMIELNSKDLGINGDSINDEDNSPKDYIKIKKLKTKLIITISAILLLIIIISIIIIFIYI